MDKKTQNLVLLFVSSFLLLTASRNVPDSGSTLMDYTQGFLAGMGILGMLLFIVALGRYKRSQ